VRGRTARLCPFESLEEVHETLNRLEEWHIVRQLPRQPGQKESRFIHLLAAEPEISKKEPVLITGSVPGPDSEHDGKIEREIEALRNDLESLKRDFLEFKKRFD
jgi:hypothetical protein